MAYDQQHPGNYDKAINLAKCNITVWHSFEKQMEGKLWRVDGRLLVSAVMGGVIVGIGAYGQRYRHRPFTRYIFQVATGVFLPIISAILSSSTGVVTSISSHDLNDFSRSAPGLTAMCIPTGHSILVVTWALLVQNVMINTHTIVAVGNKEGTSIGPPIQLIAQGAWVLYLGISYIVSVQGNIPFYYYLIEVTPFLLTLAKLVFKTYATIKAQESFAFGQNPCLISAYMQQLHAGVRSISVLRLDDVQPQSVLTLDDVETQSGLTLADVQPQLLVMGEHASHVERLDDGEYVFRGHSKKELVTIDSIWHLLDDIRVFLPEPTVERLKDLCLSFSMFKLLRCRFARLELAANASSQDSFIFFWRLLIKNAKPDRVFGLIADELTFLHDYYNSPLPISYSQGWLPLLGTIISLFSICYSIAFAVWIMIHIIVGMKFVHFNLSTDWVLRQLHCDIRCKDGKDVVSVQFGSMFFDIVPLFLLLVFVIAAEVRDMVSYICSNWTKVFFTCRVLPNNWRSLLRKWCVRRLLRCRCKIMKNCWDERMGQCSVLHLRPRSTLLALVSRFLNFLKNLSCCFLNLPHKKVKLNTDVKVSIMDALISSINEDQLSNGKGSLRRRTGEMFLWACESKSVSKVILTWQIATSILDLRYHVNKQCLSSISDRRVIVATHLSRYCTYLVASYPELLPGDDEWSKILYETVKKDADVLVAESSMRGSYEQLMEQLMIHDMLRDGGSAHQVLKDGVKLGKQLVETFNGKLEEAWNLLADFWLEMILYVAPSDNLEGHKESIARGGELITLLWALLHHVGIISSGATEPAVPNSWAGV